MSTAIYLHGFASGPSSGKATYLKRRLQERGVDLVTPDLNLPDFPSLTITRMLQQTRALIDGSAGPLTLIGSSLGAFVAVNAAAAQPDRVTRLVLLAPALDLSDFGGAALDEWRRTGSMPIFHFAYGRLLPIKYALYEDARRYDPFNATIALPTLVFQGRGDVIVRPGTIEAWARVRQNVELHLLDDDHQLGASLSYIWETLDAFLRRPAPGLTSKSPGNPPESASGRS